MANSTNVFGREIDPRVGQISITSANAFLRRVFTIMGLGLLITGVAAFFFAQYLLDNPSVAQQVFNSPLRWVLMLAPLGIVLWMSFGFNRLSYSTASVLFGVYALLMGLSLSWIFLIYTAGSIALTFFVTAGLFGVMALIGFTTKVDLTKYSSYFMFALVGLLIAMMVNWFVGSSTLDFIVSGIGVVLFCGLTAFDVQRLLSVSLMDDHRSEPMMKMAVMGALALYLDFINLFLFLLRFLGNRE